MSQQILVEVQHKFNVSLRPNLMYLAVFYWSKSPALRSLSYAIALLLTRGQLLI